MVEPASSRVQKNADQAAHRGVLSQKKLTILLDFFLVLLPHPYFFANIWSNTQVYCQNL
jgi:hypothetical protein